MGCISFGIETPRYVTSEQIQAAKRMDLLTYLQCYEPQELVRLSAGNYCTRTHDSLKISNGKWHWFSRGIGGRSALDYLIKVKGLPFTEAVAKLANAPEQPPPFSYAQKQEERHIELPQIARSSVFAARYLLQRGIDWEVIKQCQEQNLLLETKDHRNAVFAGYDSFGVIRYAALRGIYSNFKGEAKGSDKRFSFQMPGSSNASTVHLFESAVDAMSYATLLKLSGSSWRQEPLLSLGGVSDSRVSKSIPISLQHCLSTRPNTLGIVLHLDNDTAGRNASTGIIEALESEYTITDLPPPSQFKDVNDFLTHHLQQHRATKEQAR